MELVKESASPFTFADVCEVSEYLLPVDRRSYRIPDQPTSQAFAAVAANKIVAAADHQSSPPQPESSWYNEAVLIMVDSFRPLLPHSLALGICLFAFTLFAADAPDSGSKDKDGFEVLFDGATTNGWDGDGSVFRVESNCIVGGQLKERIPHNYFLSHERDFGDFELRLQFRLVGDSTNAGIQIRSERIPDHHEMIGYQADLGQQYWGCLYDESRRRKILAKPDAKELDKVLKRDGWNDYRILCEGPRIRLWVNGLQTVDYTEEDKDIALTGKIAVQIHGGAPGEAWYRNIRIKPLKNSLP